MTLPLNQSTTLSIDPVLRMWMKRHAVTLAAVPSADGGLVVRGFNPTNQRTLGFTITEQQLQEGGWLFHFSDCLKNLTYLLESEEPQVVIQYSKMLMNEAQVFDTSAPTSERLQ